MSGAYYELVSTSRIKRNERHANPQNLTGDSVPYTAALPGSSPYQRFQWARQGSMVDLAPYDVKVPKDPASEMRARYNDPHVVSLERKVLGERLLNPTFVSTLDLNDWSRKDESREQARKAAQKKEAAERAGANAGGPARDQSRNLRHRASLEIGREGSFPAHYRSAAREAFPEQPTSLPPPSGGRFAWPRTSSTVPLGGHPNDTYRPAAVLPSALDNDPISMAASPRVLKAPGGGPGALTYSALAASTGRAQGSAASSPRKLPGGGGGEEVGLPYLRSPHLYVYDHEDPARATLERSLASPSRLAAPPRLAPPGETVNYGRGVMWDKFKSSAGLITGEDVPDATLSDSGPRHGRPDPTAVPGAPRPAPLASGQRPLPPATTSHEAHYRNPSVVHMLPAPPKRCHGFRTSSNAPIHGNLNSASTLTSLRS